MDYTGSYRYFPGGRVHLEAIEEGGPLVWNQSGKYRQIGILQGYYRTSGGSPYNLFLSTLGLADFLKKHVSTSFTNLTTPTSQRLKRLKRLTSKKLPTTGERARKTQQSEETLTDYCLALLAFFSYEFVTLSFLAICFRNVE